MTEQALVSIVVPVYNMEAYLAKCVDSLLNQTYRKIEIILVNDGSKDQSLEICQQYAKADQRVKVINKKNGGLSDTRNVGIRQANGQYLMFVDSDDYVAEDFCEVAVTNIEKYSADICCTGYFGVENGDITKEIVDFKEGLISKEQAMQLTIEDSHAWDKIYKSTLFAQLEYPVGKVYEDTYLTYQLFEKAEKIAYVPKAIYYYVDRETSIVSEMSPKNIADQFDSSNEQYKFFQAKYPAVATGMAEFMLVRALRYCTYCPKNYNRALYEQAYQIIKTSPVDPATLDRRYQVTMKLFRFSAPLALAIFKLRKLTNR